MSPFPVFLAVSPTPDFWIRLGLALLSVPLLYLVLAEQGEALRGKPASMLRRAAFSLLGGFVLFNVTANWVPEQRPGNQGGAFRSYFQGIYAFRGSYSQLAEASPEMAEQMSVKEAREELEKAVQLSPESAVFRRNLGIVRAADRDYAGARQALNEAMDRLATRAPDRAAAERALWSRLFADPPPTAKEIEAIRPELSRLELGWMGDVAVLAAYERLGTNAAPRQVENAVMDGANSWFQRVLSGTMVPFFIFPQLGLISVVVLLVLVRTGVLQPASLNQHAVSAILWESFILMMALGAVPLLWVVGGKRPAPETQPGLFSGLILLREVSQLLALVYLWFRLRGQGLRLSEIGLTTRSFWANVLIGVMAATVLMPAAAVIGLITQALSERLFPNVAPPYHPLNGMTATSSSFEVRAALFIAAAVGAPIIEEIFFRGALFGALRRRWGYWPALLGSSAFFAILHPQLPLGFLPIAVLGAAFCALYEWRQSLVPGIVAHAVNNGMAYLMLSLAFPSRN